MCALPTNTTLHHLKTQHTSSIHLRKIKKKEKKGLENGKSLPDVETAGYEFFPATAAFFPRISGVAAQILLVQLL